MAVRIRLAVAALAAFLPAGTAVADMGSIPFKLGVSIFEPNQRALIAYDGREQILILSTDLRASEPTKVLEVIPFPSEPEVKNGNNEVFAKADELIIRKLREAPAEDKKGMGGFGGGMGRA